jgi:small nuclear ribonucleoprotein (snRNP)-like protein
MGMMTVEGYNNYDEFDYTRNLHGKCKRYMYHHVVLTTQDGSSFDGIIEGVDDNGVSVLVGEDVMEQERDDLEDQRFYGYGGYGDYGGYGRPRRRFRRFRRQFFPIAALAALSLLPYAYPYPYPYYPPYYPYY